MIKAQHLSLWAGVGLLLLQGCSPDASTPAVGEGGGPEESASGVRIETVSTKPWLVTGGDVLVQVDLEEGLDAAQLQVRLDGTDVSAHFQAVGQNRLQALLSGLQEGESTLTAQVIETADVATLAVTNYPIEGPIISGPHEEPFFCQTQDFETVTGQPLGPPLDDDCAVATRMDYVYWSDTEEAFKPLSENGSNGSFPADMAETTTMDGVTVPFIIRVETGTINRAVYEIALLHDPADPEPDPWTRSQGWNGKLVYTHGGGCRSGWYQQGNSTGGVLHHGLLERGYAVASSSLNVFGNNCNDLLASETHIMVKEHFVEAYGVPTYTIATGGSGGSYQSHQTADNYPGIFDGLIVSASFPDVTSATIFTLADSRLLHHYFTEVAPSTFTQEQQRAIAGFGAWGSIANLARGAARLDPLFEADTAPEEQGGEVSLTALEALRYDATNPDGVRATVYDHTVNVYGRVSNTGPAARPLDNRGVQYGLAALNEGQITPRDFLDLNRDIGGFDRDMNHVPERHQADARAARRAIESGRILSGGGGLSHTPVIDFRSYTDDREGGDIHMIVHQFSTRQRLLKANGHADNHVMNVGGRWGFTEDRPDLGQLFRFMDAWLMGIKEDTAELDPAMKVVRNKPDELVDACWDHTGDSRVLVKEKQTYEGASRCNELYPAYPTPRHVAGAPLANDIVSCQLKPVDPEDYSVAFTPEELAELDDIFPEGVCDWAKGDAHGTSYRGPWLSFGPSSVNRVP